MSDLWKVDVQPESHKHLHHKYYGPAGEPASPVELLDAVHWKMPDGTTVWFYPGVFEDVLGSAPEDVEVTCDGYRWTASQEKFEHNGFERSKMRATQVAQDYVHAQGGVVDK